MFFENDIKSYYIKYEESKIYFIKALNSCPFIWSCWVDLCFVLKQIGCKNSFNQINDHWMKYFYLENYFSGNKDSAYHYMYFISGFLSLISTFIGFFENDEKKTVF